MPGVEPRRLPPVHDISAGAPRGGVGESRKQSRDLGRVVLTIAVEHHDAGSPTTAESFHQRRRFPQSTFLTDPMDPGIGGCRSDLPPGGVGGAVVDEKQLPGESSGIETGGNLANEGSDVPRLVPHRHHERDVGEGHAEVCCGGIRRWGNWSWSGPVAGSGYRGPVEPAMPPGRSAPQASAAYSGRGVAGKGFPAAVPTVTLWSRGGRRVGWQDQGGGR